MSKFIKVTEVKYGSRNTCFGITSYKITNPILVNADHIVKVEDRCIHMIDFKICVEESFEQIQKLLTKKENQNEEDYVQ